MQKVVVPPTNFATGMKVEERSFTWTIDNFPLIRRHKSMIHSQRIDFTAGETTGHPSKWVASLQEWKEDPGKRWIDIALQLYSPKPTDDIFKHLHSEFRFIIKDKDGKIIKDEGTGVMHISTKFTAAATVTAWGSSRLIDADEANFSPEESLVIHITFQYYTPSSAKLTSSLEAIQEKFQVKFLDQLRKDFAGLLETPDACTDIKIISSDKMEFSMKKGILAARSEVFAAMLRSDMIEANSGVVKLPEISSKALNVFLNFLKTGVLLSGWRVTAVLLELTNAAAEYQIKDLLQFLDEAMGKVCHLENVLALAALARQLSLKVAEEELMMFVRKEGVSTLDNAFQIWNAELPEVDIAPTPAAAANKGKKRKRIIVGERGQARVI